ncbi:hypothetical protein [Peribacillus simplex]|uniref:hypothetical protein n=1 Tax=Peribacillus simplex TaxID=1478 RepID=UPI003D2C6B03
MSYNHRRCHEQRERVITRGGKRIIEVKIRKGVRKEHYYPVFEREFRNEHFYPVNEREFRNEHFHPVNPVGFHPVNPVNPVNPVSPVGFNNFNRCNPFWN